MCFADQVQLVSSEAVQWPNACLGVNPPTVACADVLTPGYRIILQANGQQYEYHADQNASNVVLAGSPQTGGENVLLNFDYVGGIAGFCTQMTVFKSGLLRALDCQGGTVSQPILTTLGQDQLNQLQQWADQYQNFMVDQHTPAEVDVLNTALTFNGQGNNTPSQEQQQEIFNYVYNLFTEYSAPTGGQ